MNTAKQIKACSTIDRTEFSALDIKLLNKAAALLIKHGALSTDRMASMLKLYNRDIEWAMFTLNAVEGGGLWTLAEPADDFWAARFSRVA